MCSDEFDTGWDDSCGSDFDTSFGSDDCSCFDDPFPTDFSCAFDDSMLSAEDVGAITEDVMFLEESVSSLNEDTFNGMDDGDTFNEVISSDISDDNITFIDEMHDIEFDRLDVSDNPVQSIDDDCPSVNPGSGLPMSTCSIDVGGYVYGDGPSNFDDDWL